MGKAEPMTDAERQLRNWIVSDGGRKAIQKTLEAAVETTRHLQRLRVVSLDDMNQQVTI